MSTSKIAFFGATGDCAGYCLVSALTAGQDCVALARTPAKLTKSLKDKGVPTEALDQHLTITQGNVKDVEAVKTALQIKGDVVDFIVSGIGAAPKYQWSLRQPFSLDDPKVCQSAGSTILQALRELNSEKKPVMINVMTTGIPPEGKPWDVPKLFTWLYYYMLQVPHEDKGALQEMLAKHVQLPEEQKALSGFVNVKASLLMDGKSLGLQTVREGVEDAPAIGYTIRRSDVGLWIYERLLKTGVKDEWLNKGVCITY
ncbi:MAG: hypothetical protein M4579_005208 [Chaenotheca gracillima]|nr:MAG: hypothetical protein M4579_005208 [Chaenotheca gracillima]